MVAAIQAPDAARGVFGKLEIIDVNVPKVESLKPGKVQAVGGLAADAYIRKASELALAGRIDAVATAPISKEALRAAGIGEIGHTELFANYMNAPEPLTLFITENMRIFFLSRHMPLRRAISYVTEDRVLRTIRRVHHAMGGLGFRKPRIGVAALNPHASDGGQFGDEEQTIIAPAVSRAQSDGIDVIGPVSADSVFHQALDGRFDCVIALYHDQGHIAAKTRDFFRTVTATLGLPVLRTSVDHGTGFDIAWQGKASSVSMEAAILAIPGLMP
jgi:4-hydroxythreonine-4-phosphate dehydrogenase